MTLIVEDGTGKADADTYNDVVAFDTYCAKRNRDTSGYDTAAKEAALIEASQYCDTNWRFRAQVANNGQAKQFPRVGLTDRDGRTYDGIIPKALKDAECEAAWIAIQGETLYLNVDRGGQVVSESVGPISTTYAQSAPAGKLYQAVEALLRPLTVREGELQRPLPSVPDNVLDGSDPMFGVGMNDNPDNTGDADAGYL